MGNKLDLPIITDKLPEPKHLSMDEYVKFVELNLNSMFNRTNYKKQKKKQFVTVPFKLIEK